MAARRRVALVSCASSGIGQAVSRALVAAGFDVVGADRGGAVVDPGGDVGVDGLDVTKGASITTLVERVVERFGWIDVLVNTAVVGSERPLSSGARAQCDLDSNLLSLVRMTQAVLPFMRSQRSGRIINLPSIAGLVDGPYLAAERASRQLVEGYSTAVDHEVRQDGVRVLVVVPGASGDGSRLGRTTAVTCATDDARPLEGKRRRITEQGAASLQADRPLALIARAVVTAATTPDPRPRYAAAIPGGRLEALALSRVAPAQIRAPHMFDAPVRKYNQLPG
ncbi:SDR family NAD(P)-dependent oxidoreductase [Promicromonospora sp. NPDC060204]|uniref:SDR family NAD(P)-dependent oxidoreductase n=1 Tax=Promicromonospora sp. NPDC060204 TaxID=3347071 RepID=UPI003654749F